MSSDDSLPVILVSAVDIKTATDMISELVEDEAAAGERAGQGQGEARVWSLHNKYYRARVLLCARPDAPEARPDTRPDAPDARPDTPHARPDAPDARPDASDTRPDAPDALPDAPDALAERIEAHVVVLAPHEVSGAELTARAGCAGCVGCGVRLALYRGAGEPAALRRAAARLRYELVALGDADTGLARARQALHAHAWPGLTLHAAHPARPDADGDTDEEETGAEAEEDEEEAALRRAEQFVEALGALGGAARGEGAAGGEAGEGEWRAARGERVRRAEAMVAAFCSALGAQLRDC